MNTKMWKRIKLPLVLAVGTALIAGCSSSNDPSATNAGGASASPEPTAKTEPPAAKVEISFMNMWAKDNTENVATSVREALAKFQEENPNIVIKEDAIGDQNAYYTKLKTLAASNDLPDIFISKGSELTMFAANGTVAPLDDLLAEDADWKNGFLPTAFNDLSNGGQTFGIPFSMLATSVVYYNKQIFAEAGYDTFPATWSEFEDAIGKIKAQGLTPIALGNKEQWVAQSCILSALGDRFTGPEWFDSIRNKGGAKFTDAEFVQSLTALQGLAQAGAFNSDLNSINNDQQKTLYFNGKAAMFLEGSWAIGAVASAPKEIADNTGVAVLPSVEGGKGNPLATAGGAGSGYAVGVNGYDTKKEAITQVLKAISGAEFAASLAEKGEPTAFVVDNYDKSNVSPLAVEYAELSSKLQFTPIYDSYLSPALVSTVNAGLQDLLIDAVSPEELAKRIQTDYEKAS